MRFVIVNGGEPGGLTCVWGPDGRHVWWNPPEGCKVRDLLEDTYSPCEMRVVIIGARDGRDAGPTTVMGPDGRLVWLESSPRESAAGNCWICCGHVRTQAVHDLLKQAPLLAPVDPANDGPQVSLVEAPDGR